MRDLIGPYAYPEPVVGVWKASVGAAALLALTSRPSGAEEPGVDLTSLSTPMHQEGSPGGEPTGTQPAGEHQVGLLMGYGLDAVALENEAGNRLNTPVRHQWLMHYTGTLGVGPRLSFGIDLPVALYQNGDDTSQVFADGGALPHSAFGDLALRVKGRLLDTSASRGFGLSLLGSIQTPTGDPRSYLSDDATRLGARVLTELEALALVVRASAGANFRTSEQQFLNQRFSHGLPWSISATLRPQALGWDDGGRWRFTVESYGALATNPEFAAAAASPARAGLNARYAIGDVGLFFGTELPLSSAAGVPRIRGLLGINWAPRHRDADGDSLLDSEDLCPELAEDKDGFEDDDGCPDHDDDLDGVPDRFDRCPDPREPNSREDADGFADDDGCEDIDNDGDGVLDAVDACPNQAGDDVAGMRARGCPLKDTDQDGIFDDFDECPNKAEDRDGYFDHDGCPDRDNDGDGIADRRDHCPDQKGKSSRIADYHGCPSPDRDGDTYPDSDDQCPKQAEDFDGDRDRDGCPDAEESEPGAGRARAATRLLAKVVELDSNQFVEFAQPLKITQLEDHSFVIDEIERPKLRAVAQLLNESPRRYALVAVRAQGTLSPKEAKLQAKLIASEIEQLTFGMRSARVGAFDAFSAHPGSARSGIGIQLLQVKRKVRIPKAPTRRKQRGQSSPDIAGQPEDKQDMPAPVRTPEAKP